jgi:hypothetical protein
MRATLCAHDNQFQRTKRATPRRAMRLALRLPFVMHAPRAVRALDLGVDALHQSLLPCVGQSISVGFAATRPGVVANEAHGQHLAHFGQGYSRHCASIPARLTAHPGEVGHCLLKGLDVHPQPGFLRAQPRKPHLLARHGLDTGAHELPFSTTLTQIRIVY